MRLLIRGGRVVDPASGLDGIRDLRIGAVVEEIGEALSPEPGEELFDARGCVVAPGFIDMHVHLREPGNAEKETLESGSEAALRGGFTAIACMPNTTPAIDDRAKLATLREEIARRARCHVYPIAAITRERAGAAPCDYAALAAAGAVAFSDDGDAVRDGALLYRAARTAVPLSAPFISHCEPERTIVARDLVIARASAKRWHLAHLSTRAGLEMLRAAREQGVAVTAEVTPHHLLCTSKDEERLGAMASVHPPLRTEEDARALRDGVRDGTIEVFASDHAPHTAEQKNAGAPGFSSLEIAVGAYAAALPDLPVSRFVAMLSANPARLLGVPGGRLRRGAAGDVTVFRDLPWRVDARRFASLGTCTPFDGMTLPRRIVATIVGGEIRCRA